MKSSYLPSAPPPPSYQESESDFNASIPDVHGQYTRASYGSVHATSLTPLSQPGVMTVQHGHYYSSYPPPQPVILQPTVVNNRTVIQPIYLEPLLGMKSCYVFCIVCQQRVKSKTSNSYPCCAHFCFCLMFLSVGLCPCSPLAYCCFQPQKVIHTCPHCKAIIGTYIPTDDD